MATGFLFFFAFQPLWESRQMKSQRRKLDGHVKKMIQRIDDHEKSTKGQLIVDCTDFDLFTHQRESAAKRTTVPSCQQMPPLAPTRAIPHSAEVDECDQVLQRTVQDVLMRSCARTTGVSSNSSCCVPSVKPLRLRPNQCKMQTDTPGPGEYEICLKPFSHGPTFGLSRRLA